MNYDVLIPVISRNLSVLKINIPYIRRNIDVKRIVIVGNSKLKSVISELGTDICFIDENSLIKGLSLDNIEKLVRGRDSFASARAGWYFQQFLKMAYSLICDDSFYFTLDADTIPVRKIDMFDSDGKPFFDTKTEYNAPYFTTLKKLFGLTKKIDSSFISEHMIFNTEYMRVLISQIEENNCLVGESFFEKIINAIRLPDLLKSGFSEFETYGTFVVSKYPDEYKLRVLTSLRQGDKFLGLEPSNEMLAWAAESYCFVSFEDRKKLDKQIIDYSVQNMNKKTLFKIVEDFSKIS